ncbi:glycosyltransferase family protein [Croceibacterium mercuriale]|uniref:hypothetical protein n=1 Tax=Croceibacterium mercuriale TaxID=1572751 RepID=UPI00126A693C|nr:hypothetical protein [Croceibacterium mercuriale]
MSVSEDERRRIVVVIVGENDFPTRIQNALDGVKVIFADVNDEHGLLEGEAVAPPRWAYRNSDWHWRSYVALRVLRDLHRRSGIDYIEFTDWGGLGYCTTQEKKLGLGFAGVAIAVRLHGPHGVLLCTERYSLTENDLCIFDLERKALRDCDLVIAQTMPYFEKVREVFGFDHGEWYGRLVYSPLPVIIDSAPKTSWRLGERTKCITFTSKFQNIKRPELFVRGVSQFLASKEGDGWAAVYCARIADSGSKAAVVGRTPAGLRSRFAFKGDIQGAERDELIASSVVVVSSICESFCLAAFEASLLGALVILNEANPSFGDRTLWKDGHNCLKFDGTASGLAAALRRASSSSATLQPVALGAFERPWQTRGRTPEDQPQIAKAEGISVIIYGADDVEKLLCSMRNIAAVEHDQIELIVALAGEGSELRGVLEEQITAANDPLVRLVSNPADDSLGAILNRAWAECSSDHVLIMRAGDMIHSKFLAKVSGAFGVDPSTAGIISHIGFFDRDALPNTQEAMSCFKYQVVVGESFLSGYLKNHSGAGPIAVRKSLLGETPFSEELQEDFMWALHHSLRSSGSRVVCLNDVYAFCEATTEIAASTRDIRTKTLSQHEIMQTTSLPTARNGSGYLTTSFAYAVLENLESIRTQGQQPITRVGSNERNQFVSLKNNDPDRTALHNLLDKPRSLSWSNIIFFGAGLFGKRTKTADVRLLRKSAGFDAGWYLAQYPDVKAAGLDPLGHYLDFGAVEGRRPNPHFDSEAYLQANPDVRAAGLNPLVHYILHGREEARPLRH